MLILDKKRDYYDYLVGIYGRDEKRILDRRDGYHTEFPQSYLRFYIAGYVIEGLYVDGKFYYGQTLNKFKFDKTNRRIWFSKHYNRNYDKSIEVEFKGPVWHQEWIYLEPIIDKKELNFRFDCPILLDLQPTWKDKKVVKFPLLKDYGINKFIDAETMYTWIETWLGKRITLKEQFPELSNEDKISSKGMSNKTSFRPKIK